MTTYLSILPDELLLNIVSLIDDNKSLCALARVSRRFQSLSEPVIYSALLLRTSQACNHLKYSIESSPRRATYIRVLDLRPEYTNGISDYGKTITSILSQCFRLRELTLESPTCNYGRWVSSTHGWKDIEANIPPSLMEAMGFASTRGLAKLVLHLDGYQNRYWDPNAGQENAKVMWSTVMALPTLNELTISCACIHDAVHTGEARSSSLKKLTLIECNMTIGGLNKMLSAPKALENLYLGMNFHLILRTDC
jgi:F-box associated protein